MEDFLDDLAGIGGGAAAGTYIGTSIGGPVGAGVGAVGGAVVGPVVKKTVGVLKDIPVVGDVLDGVEEVFDFIF